MNALKSVDLSMGVESKTRRIVLASWQVSRIAKFFSVVEKGLGSSTAVALEMDGDERLRLSADSGFDVKVILELDTKPRDITSG